MGRSLASTRIGFWLRIIECYLVAAGSIVSWTLVVRLFVGLYMATAYGGARFVTDFLWPRTKPWQFWVFLPFCIVKRGRRLPAGAAGTAAARQGRVDSVAGGQDVERAASEPAGYSMRVVHQRLRLLIVFLTVIRGPFALLPNAP